MLVKVLVTPNMHFIRQSDVDALSSHYIYRATLYVSAVFAVARCPSVRPSLCWLYPGRRLKISSNFFVGPVDPSFCLSGPQCRYPIPSGTSSTGAQNPRGWENFAIFDWNRRLSRKRYEIGPWLQWNVNRKLYSLYRIVTFSTTLTIPNPVVKDTAHLKLNIS